MGGDGEEPTSPWREGVNNVVLITPLATSEGYFI